MTFALQNKRINGNANKASQQRCSKVVPQVRDLYAPADPSSQRILSRTLDRPPELADVVSYPSKR
jgi:hypothetical protein